MISLLRRYVFSNPLLLCDDVDNNHRRRLSMIIPMPAVGWDGGPHPNDDDNATRIMVSLELITHHFHLQMTVLLLLQVMISHLLAIVTYYAIVRPRQKQQQQPKNTSSLLLSSLLPFMIGYGIIIPCALLFPFVVVDLFDIRNHAVRFCGIMVPFTCTLKCCYAMHHYPIDNHDPIWSIRTRSWRHFIYYMGYFHYPVYNQINHNDTGRRDDDHHKKDDDFNPAKDHDDSQQLRQDEPQQHKLPSTNEASVSTRIVKKASFLYYKKLMNQCITWYVILILLYSLLIPYDFQPFVSSHERSHIPHDDMYPTISLLRIYQNALLGLVMYGTFQMSMSGVSLFVSLVSFHSEFDNVEIFDRPYLYASSPSNFWGRRWNKLMHTALKEGIYQPILQQYDRYYHRPPPPDRMTASSKNRRNHGSHAIKLISKMITFLVSGLLHEYVTLLLFYKNRYERSSHSSSRSGGFFSFFDGLTDQGSAVFGKHMIFFGWNGIALLMEQIIMTASDRLSRHHHYVKSTLLFYRTISQYTIVRLMIGHAVLLGMILPVLHLFTDDLLIKGGYFDGLRCIVPYFIITTVPSPSPNATTTTLSF